MPQSLHSSQYSPMPLPWRTGMLVQPQGRAVSGVGSSHFLISSLGLRRTGGALTIRSHGASKVSETSAENPAMKNERIQLVLNDDPLRAEALSLAASIEAIRRACGKKNPRDFKVDTPEWEATCIEFARDLRWALGMGDDDSTDVPAIESKIKRLPSLTNRD
ncbi:hypothetical protein [Caballeronia grimmiae]|uniref:hypothetical protein n=1 Tax=Caballeronia grimmiae TaxID=1071679 RepID=UPI0038BD8699